VVLDHPRNSVSTEGGGLVGMQSDAKLVSPEMPFASDAIKQVLTLATGVLTLSLTFHSSFAGRRPTSQETFLFWGWGLLSVAVVLGVFCLLTVTGAVWGAKDSREWQVRIPWIGQLLTFMAGVILMVMFAFDVA
jgi:hypothetical protein